jgi:glycine cleavage system aminomethyltransferase T
VIRLAEERYRTYWLNPPIDYLVKSSDMDITGEDLTGKEYFIQISGESSLEILEDAFEADLHDIKFARHRKDIMDGREVEIIRLGMSGNLAYEIHGPVQDYDFVYRKVWASGEKFGARKLGMHAYNIFNHTEAGFPNIHQHYPLPWFESGEGLANYLYQNPMLGAQNINRRLVGSVGEDLESRFVTPYDVGWGSLVKFNHDFRGREALEKVAQNPPRTVTTLEWNADDVGAVFASMFRPGEMPCDDISKQSDMPLTENTFFGYGEYRADRVLAHGKDIGITSGRIISYPYNSMISLAFIQPEFVKEGTEVTIVWGTPGTPEKEIRAKVARYPYNGDLVRNEDRDVEDIPRYKKK